MSASGGVTLTVVSAVILLLSTLWLTTTLLDDYMRRDWARSGASTLGFVGFGAFGLAGGILGILGGKQSDRGRLRLSVIFGVVACVCWFASAVAVGVLMRSVGIIGILWSVFLLSAVVLSPAIVGVSLTAAEYIKCAGIPDGATPMKSVAAATYV